MWPVSLGESPSRSAMKWAGSPVPPRQQADHSNGVRIGHPGEAGVGGGPFDRIAHERDRLPPVVDRSGTMRDLAGADEHGGAGVEGHGAAGYESVGRTRQPGSPVRRLSGRLESCRAGAGTRPYDPPP